MNLNDEFYIKYKLKHFYCPIDISINNIVVVIKHDYFFIAMEF